MQHHQLIDKLVVFGVPNPERLKLSQIVANHIKVAPLEFYNIHNTFEAETQIDYEMWAYPDGIKIYNQQHQIINTHHPQFSFTHPSDIISDNRQIQKPSFLGNQNKYQMKRNSYPNDYIYSFVLTDYQLNRTYCTCLSWNEKIFVKNDLLKNNSSVKSHSIGQSDIINILEQYTNNEQKYSKTLPKCRIQSLINNPLILDPTVSLVYVPKSLILCSSNKICFQFHRQILTNFYNSIIMPKRQNNYIQNPQIKISDKLYRQFEQLCRNNGYPLAQKIFDSDDYRKQQTSHSSQQNCVLSVKKNKLKQFYLAAMFLPKTSNKQISVISQNGHPLSAFINLKTAYKMPDFYDPYSDYYNLLPLPIQKIIILWKNLLLEKQVLIFAHSQFQAILLCQFLLYLLQPIKWQNIYIPFLPFHLYNHIDAIGGYLIGMSHIHLNYIREEFDLKNRIIVDLKTKTIEDYSVTRSQLPENVQNYLQSNGQTLVRKYQAQILQLKGNSGLGSFLSISPDKASQKHSISQKTTRKTLQIQFTLELQQLFFNSIVFLLNNFIPFIERRLQGVISFKTNQYLKILTDQKHQTLMKQITRTMVFIRLCEYHFQQSQKCAWVQRSIGQLFVYSYQILSQRYHIKSKDHQQQKVYEWPLQQLLNSDNKYQQYHSYLLKKNLTEIVDMIKISDIYFMEQTHKNSLYQNNSIKNNQNMSQKSIDQRLSSRRQISWKHGKNKSQYQKSEKIIDDVKIEKYLVKYLKYLELNDPKRILKINSKQQRKRIQPQRGWIGWLWEVFNPPVVSIRKKQKQRKSKLKRKMTQIGSIFNLAVNLHCLFINKQQNRHIPKKQKSPKTQKHNLIREEQNIIDFSLYDPDPRISKTHSEDAKKIIKRRKSNY